MARSFISSSSSNVATGAALGLGGYFGIKAAKFAEGFVASKVSEFKSVKEAAPEAIGFTDTAKSVITNKYVVVASTAVSVAALGYAAYTYFKKTKAEKAHDAKQAAAKQEAAPAATTETSTTVEEAPVTTASVKAEPVKAAPQAVKQEAAGATGSDTKSGTDATGNNSAHQDDAAK